MGLFAVYRIKNGDNQLQVFFSDIRQDGAVEHLCLLPNLPDCLSLIREITDQLAAMEFVLEYDSKLDTKDEVRIVAAHAIPAGAGSSADAIRVVCSRLDITPSIVTSEGKGFQLPTEH